MAPHLLLLSAPLLSAAAAWFLARSQGLGRTAAALAAAGCAGSGLALEALGVPAARAAAPAWDPVALGAVLLVAGAVSAARRAPAPEGGPEAWRVPRAIGFALLALALAVVLDRRGLPREAPDLLALGPPLPRAWVAPPILALALASLASGTGRLRARGVCAAVGFPAMLVALGDPGVGGMARMLPLAWETVEAVAAAVAALLLSLLAADALESAPRASRLAAGLALVAWAALALVPGPAGPRGAHGDPDDELVVFTERPPAQCSGGALRVRGRLHVAVPADGLQLALAPAEAAGPTETVRIQLRPAEGDWRAFESEFVEIATLAPGAWRLDVDVLRSGARIGTRTAGVVAVERGTSTRSRLLGLAVALLAVLLPRRTALAWLSALLAVASGLVAALTPGA